jgi:hypothetical protein
MKTPAFVGRLARRTPRVPLALAFLVAIAGSVSLFAQSQSFNPALERQLWKSLNPMGFDIASGPNAVPLPRRVSVNVGSSASIDLDQSYFDDISNQQINFSLTWTDAEQGDQDQRALMGFAKERARLLHTTLDSLVDVEDLLGSINPLNPLDLLINPLSVLNQNANNGQCTFSHLGDWDPETPNYRLCKDGLRMVPPPPGSLLGPVGLAVDGATVYVVDDMNHRVQAFDFDGRVRPMQFPIGNGVPGTGPYNVETDPVHHNVVTGAGEAYRPFSSFPGLAPAVANGGFSGEKLKAPNGLVVDGSRNLVISDAGNYRIAVFNPDGVMQFTVPIADHLGTPFKPTNIAMTPGSVALPLGSAIPVGAEDDRIVLTDWSHCYVRIYRINFEPVVTYPTQKPQFGQHDPIDGCASPGDSENPLNPPRNTQAGEFSTVTGAIIDAQSHIFVTDHAQSVVQVFNKDGATIGWIGKPGVQAAPGELNGPVGLAIDYDERLGDRLGVIDGNNARVVFYTLSYDPDTEEPTATFEFQLDINAAIQDFPMGLMKQQGTGPGLDPKGRWMATDPQNRRVLRFELPELGIADEDARILDPQPLDAPEDLLVGRGTFKVLVPRQKLNPVLDVEVEVTTSTDGVTVMPGTTKAILPELPVGTFPDIAPAEYVAYEFFYTTTENVAKAIFDINAKGDKVGNVYTAIAPEGQAESRAECSSCDATHELWWAEEAGLATPTNDWYPKKLMVRLMPTEGSFDVEAIGWQYGGVAGIFYPQRTDVQETLLNGNPYIEVPVSTEGLNYLSYWAITGDGAIGPTHTVEPTGRPDGAGIGLRIDLTDPGVTFINQPPYTGTTDGDGRNWYNHQVTVSYNVSDALSGTDADVQPLPTNPDGQQIITTNGRDQIITVNVVDRAGHDISVPSPYVNIDTVYPEFGPSLPSEIRLVVIGEDENGPYGVVTSTDYNVTTAFDPPLANDAGPGSGVAILKNPFDKKFYYGVSNTFTYEVIDHAGNKTTAVVPVIVERGATTVYAPSKIVVYGERVLVMAQITPRSATGTVTFTWGSHVLTVPVRTADAFDPVLGVNVKRGEAWAAVDPVRDNVGDHWMVAAYSGDALTDPASYPSAGVEPSHVHVRVIQRPLQVVGIPAQKYVGDPDPAFNYTVSGLIFDDVAEVTLSRSVLNEAVGQHVIDHADIAVNNYYVEEYTPAKLTIIGRVTISTPGQTVTYGDPLTFPPQFTDFPLGSGLGALTSQPTCTVAGLPRPSVGSHAITCSGASAPFIEFTYAPSTLVVNPLAATIRAGSGTKIYGANDPPFVTTQTGILSADVAGITLSTTRPANENVGEYVTTPVATGGASGNYAFTEVTGTFTITPAKPVVVATGHNVTYNGAAWPGTCTVTGPNGPLPGVSTYTPGPGVPVNAGNYTLTCSFAGDLNHEAVSATATINIARVPLTITATSFTKVVGEAIPSPLPYTITNGALVGADTVMGELTREPGIAIGTYAITQGTIALTDNYILTFVPGTLTIRPVNEPPDALNDTVSTIGGAPVAFAVLDNDSDPDGDTLTIPSFTQPSVTDGSVVKTADNRFIFTPAPGFYGTTSFTYTIADGKGGFDTATVTITVSVPTGCSTTGFRTQTQGGWGTSPSGNNPAAFLAANFAQVYPTGVRIGVGNVLTFTSSNAVMNFLPAGGTAGVLNGSATNPATSSAGVFAGQVLALQLSVDFSNAGVTKRYLGDLVYQGKTVHQWLALANQVLGGNTAALAPYGLTLSGLNNIIDSFNNNFVDVTQNNGVLACPSGGSTTNPPPSSTNRAPDAVNDAATTAKNTAKTISVLSNDTDPDGNTLTISAVTQPSKGSVVKNSNGTVTFTPKSKFTGTVTFTYTISDGKGGSDTATVTVTVN